MIAKSCNLALLVCLLVCGPIAWAADDMQTVSYRGIRPDDPMGRNGLRNPERGLRIETLIAEPSGAEDVWGPAHHLVGRVTPTYSDDWWILDAEKYEPFGLTLAQTYCYLDKSMHAPIPEEKLAQLQRSFDNLRAHGLKALLRFAYEKKMRQEEGPSLETILGHMDQLAPILRENEDVIYVVQAGFIGAWGEWHSSAQELEKDKNNLAAVVAKLLEILPQHRMTQVRVPKYKRWVLENPLIGDYFVVDETTAFSGRPAARIGFHNDGFLAGKTCGGTWTEPPLFSNPGNPEFDYMTAESLYVPVDGELFWSDIEGRVDGFEAARRMRLHHYGSFSLAHSYSGREGKRYGIDVWMETPITRDEVREAGLPESDGYFEDAEGNPAPRTQFEYMRDHLGYRIELQSASFPKEAPAGGTLNVELSLINRGFATLYNPRPVEFALISPAGGVHSFAVSAADVRKWYPHRPGDPECKPITHVVKCAAKLPAGLPPGHYALGLWLPDASERLRERADYAIRTANGDVPFWTAPGDAYGINLLGSVRVTPAETQASEPRPGAPTLRRGVPTLRRGVPTLRRGVPTPEQIAWHEMELEMFLCLDPCTWQGREYDDHSTPLDEINPAQLDTDQWCEAAKAFGAKQILFVAKHTGGFCWWPTETTEYCVRNIPWKNGQGDVLGDLADSCRSHGLKLGVYIYPGDDQWGAGIGSGGKTADPARQEAYNEVLRRQWTEVLTRYGEISEIWFDGSCVIELGDIIEKYAPRAMVFQGPHATLRWPGNEKGVAPEPAWQTVKIDDAKSGVATGAHSDPDGEAWLPMEMDTPLLDHKWFWAPNTDHMIKPLDKLVDIYLKSVGRGCVLLLNATPDTSGRIPESHMRRYREFGQAIRRLYENEKGETAGEGEEFLISFDQPTPVNQVVIKEDIRNGHVVREFCVEGLIEGEWRLLAQGRPIGYKRIERFEPVAAEKIRLRTTKSAGRPRITQFAACETAGAASQAAETEAEWLPVPAWDAVAPAPDWQTVEVDLTPLIREPGQYRLQIRKTAGDAVLETGAPTLIVAGAEAPRLVSPLQEPDTWIIRRTDQVTADAKGRTTFRLRVRLAHGTSWAGQMLLKQDSP